MVELSIVRNREMRINSRSPWQDALRPLAGAVLVGCLSWSGISAGQVPAPNTAEVSSANPLKIGEYISRGRQGLLTISRSVQPGFVSFSIDSSGASDYVCKVEGETQGRTAVLDLSDDPAIACEIAFDVYPNGVISVRHDKTPGCRKYCGIRARFDLDYLVPEDGCSISAFSGRTISFESAYRAKEYRRAYEILAPVAKRCEATMSTYERIDAANDLAVTLYHLGKPAECRAVLAPYGDIAKISEKDWRKLEPMIWENWAFRSRAVRTNLKGSSRNRMGKLSA